MEYNINLNVIKDLVEESYINYIVVSNIDSLNFEFEDFSFYITLLSNMEYECSYTVKNALNDYDSLFSLIELVNNELKRQTIIYSFFEDLNEACKTHGVEFTISNNQSKDFHIDYKLQTKACGTEFIASLYYINEGIIKEHYLVKTDDKYVIRTASYVIDVIHELVDKYGLKLK